MTGVDKRIDVIATAMHFGGTVKDLTELELAYAPPFSQAKDPVNFAGYTAENILAGLSKPMTYDEMMELKDKDGYELIDVREKDEFDAGTIEGARLLPLSTLRDELPNLDKSKEYLIFCAVGRRGYITQRIMEQHGFKTRNLMGGIKTYRDMQ